MLLTIALDGPVGAGKSSVADGVAQKLGILHLDTGAMYRAFAWKALQKGVALEDEAALEALTATDLPEVRYENGEQHTYMDGQDVTGLIRTPEVSMAASTVSKAAVVRRAMVKRQQELASRQSMLLDGRDIGTRVLPDATVKFYLTASPEIRARRRFDEMQQKGQEGSYEEVLADVIKRDDQDMHREVDPLRPAEDAQIIDSSYLTQEQVVENMVRRIQLKQGQRLPGVKHTGHRQPLRVRHRLLQIFLALGQRSESEIFSVIIQAVERHKGGGIFFCLHLDLIPVAHQTAALDGFKAGLAVHHTEQLPVQDAPLLCLPVDLRQLRRLGQHPHVPLVPQLRPTLGVEIRHTPLSVPFHLVEIPFIRKRRHILRDEHGADPLFFK